MVLDGGKSVFGLSQTPMAMNKKNSSLANDSTIHGNFTTYHSTFHPMITHWLWEAANSAHCQS